MTVKVEVYYPKTEQYHAQVQGIYEYLVKKHLGLSSSAKFKQNRKRLDVSNDLPDYVIRDLLSTAFAIATKVGQKHGHLQKGSNTPTIEGKAKAAKRAGYSFHKIVAALQKEGFSVEKIHEILDNLPNVDKDYSWQNLLDYEMTLALARKGSFYRILKIKKNRKFVYFVMPKGKEYATLKEAKEGVEKMQSRKTKPLKRVANPKQKVQMSRNPKTAGSVVICYETRRCNLTEQQLRKVKSLKSLYNKTSELVGNSESFAEARAQANAAMGRNMCKYCIIFVHTIGKKLLVADTNTGAMKTMDDLQKELKGSNRPRGSL